MHLYLTAFGAVVAANIIAVFAIAASIRRNREPLKMAKVVKKSPAHANGARRATSTETR